MPVGNYSRSMSRTNALGVRTSSMAQASFSLSGLTFSLDSCTLNKRLHIIFMQVSQGGALQNRLGLTVADHSHITASNFVPVKIVIQYFLYAFSFFWSNMPHKLCFKHLAFQQHYARYQLARWAIHCIPRMKEQAIW